MGPGLRLLIDGRMLLGRFSGVARVVTRLVENLVCLPNIHVVVLCGNEPYEPWVGRYDIEMIVSNFSRGDRSPVRRLIWEATRLQNWIQESKADVFHATWNTGVPCRCPVPAVLTVHDVIPWDDSCRGLSARVAQAGYRYSLRASVARARRVTAVSGFSSVEVARRVRSDPACIRVIYNGVDEPKPIAERDLSATPSYILYVGGHEPRKNLESVFGVLARYWSDHDPTMELRLTGTVDQLGSVARIAYEKLESKDKIRFLGSPSDDDLTRQYRGAKALLLLSRSEGFGLPVIEAMSYACPVIAARGGCLPEIVGDAGLLVDPGDVRHIAQSISELISAPEKTGKLIEKGRRRAAMFSWRRAAECYLREYQHALSPSTARPRWQSQTAKRLACTS